MVFTLSRDIFNAYLHGMFIPATVYGPVRWGKSSYGAQVMAEIKGMKTLYDQGKNPYRIKKYEWDWNLDYFKRFLQWHPKNYVDMLLSITSKQLANMWDDAGYWINALEHQNPFVKAYSKYMNLTGIDFGGTIFTTPDPTWITKKVRGIPQMYVIRIDLKTNENDTARLAWGYKNWKTPDGKRWGVRTEFIDEFDVMLPDDFYDWYYPLREKYNQMAKQLMRKELSSLQDVVLEKSLYDKAIQDIQP